MKNKIKFVLLSLIISFASLYFVQVFASETVLIDYSEGSNQTYLGKSIDVVRADNYGDIAKNSILSNDYYKNISYKINTGTAGSVTEYIYGDSSEEILANINLNYCMSSSINGVSVKGFTLGASKRFTVGIDAKYKYYYSKRYIECVGKIDTKTIYIENAGSKLKKDEFIENLSDYFINDLALLNSGKLSYSSFFNAYGTHLITNYTIGDRFYGDAVFASNEMILDSSFNAGFENSIGAQVTGTNIGANASNSLNAYLSFDYGSSKNSYAAKVSCASGMVSGNDISASFKEWIQKTNANKDKLTTIVGYDIDDLVPVWDLLPSNYENLRKRMINEYILYRIFNEKNYYFQDVEPDIEQKKQEISLDDEKTIDDSDRFDYYNDFAISDSYGHLVLADKYKKIKFKISFDAKRIDQGYQYVYLYNRNDVNYKDTEHHNKYLWASGNMDLSGKLTTKEFEFEVPFTKIEGDELAIVYRASGNFSDRWLRSNLKVEMTFME